MGTKDSFRLVILSVVVLSFVAIGEAQSEPQGLKHRVVALEQDVADLESALALERQERADADAALQDQIDALDQDVGDLESALAVESQVRADADAALQGQIDALQSEIASLAVPIAFATVSHTGNILSGTPNVSVQWEAGNDRYLVSIENEDYYFADYTTTISLIGVDDTEVVTTGSIAGRLTVYVKNLSGDRVQNMFQFAVFKVPSAAQAFRPAPFSDAIFDDTE